MRMSSVPSAARGPAVRVLAALLALLAPGACRQAARTDAERPAAPAAPPPAAIEPVGDTAPPEEPAGGPAEAAAGPTGSGATLEGFSRAPQKVGTPTDGVALEAIRHAAHAGFYRFVFDLDGEVVAASEARLGADGLSLTVDLHGLRDDRTGNRPLTTESGRPFGRPVTVGTPPVRSYARALVLDDSLLRYEIHLERAAGFRLGALEAPPRVVVDIAR